MNTKTPIPPPVQSIAIELKVKDSVILRAKQIYEAAQLDAAAELKSRQEYQSEAYKLDQKLKVALSELDEHKIREVGLKGLLTTAQKERDGALVEVEKWKQSTTAVALASQEVEKELRDLLEECRVALEFWDIRFDHGPTRTALAHLKALDKAVPSTSPPTIPNHNDTDPI